MKTRKNSQKWYSIVLKTIKNGEEHLIYFNDCPKKELRYWQNAHKLYFLDVTKEIKCFKYSCIFKKTRTILLLESDIKLV